MASCCCTPVLTVLWWRNSILPGMAVRERHLDEPTHHQVTKCTRKLEPSGREERRNAENIVYMHYICVFLSQISKARRTQSNSFTALGQSDQPEPGQGRNHFPASRDPRQQVCQIPGIEIELNKYSNNFHIPRESYLTGIKWVNDSSVAVVWLNRAQNVSVTSLCQIATGICIEV